MIILFFVGVVYIRSLTGFFQHDEWTTFATYLTDNVGIGERLLAFFSPNVAHYAPLQDFFYYITFLTFGLNFTGYAAVSIFLQIITVYLVYVLGTKLFKDNLQSLLLALLFGVNASSHQATTWVATTINTHGASIFGLISIIIFLKYINGQAKSERRGIAFSFLLLFVSLLFKEIALGILAIFIFLAYTRPSKLSDKARLRLNLAIIVFGICYLLFRLSMIFFSRGDVEERLVTETQTVREVAGNIFSFPVKIFSQSLVPTRLLLKTTSTVSRVLPDSLTGQPGTTEFDIFTQEIALQIVNWTIFALALALLLWMSKKADKRAFQITLIGFIFVITNSVIYALSPGRGGSIPVVDSRNIYFPAIGTTIFLLGIMMHFKKKFGNRVLILPAILILTNVFWLSREINEASIVGSERRVILEQMKAMYPILPEKVIFYTQSDKSYYGFPENEKMFPFQLNFGYTLLVWYLPTEDFDKEFTVLGGYLYKILAEDYKEVGGRGFGYFRSLEKLKEAVRDNNLDVESVIAFEYDSAQKKLYDRTEKIREELIAND